MIITRKIQIFVSEKDAERKKEYIHQLYSWRDLVRKGANTIVSHKFTQENIKDFVYLNDEAKKRFYVQDILKEGKGMSEQNTTYRVLAAMMKGKMPADIYSCLNQAVVNAFKETKGDLYTGKTSLRSYRNNIPIPFSAKSIVNLNWNQDDKRFYFILFDIPFGTALGRDASNNRVIIERILNGEYQMRSSSIQIDDRKKKMYLLLCVDIHIKEEKINPEKTMYAFLGVFNPIVCSTDVNAEKRVYEIGTEEEFNHRRRQIQEAVKRCQINNRYSVGGKGRKKKTQAIDRFREKERNYVDTKLHTYSRMLIDLCIKHECGKLVLMRQKEREEMAKDESIVLRNWGYHGLKTKIDYKCKMYGIELIEE